MHYTCTFVHSKNNKDQSAIQCTHQQVSRGDAHSYVKLQLYFKHRLHGEDTNVPANGLVGCYLGTKKGTTPRETGHFLTHLDQNLGMCRGM